MAGTKHDPATDADDGGWRPPSPSVATRRPSASSRFASRVTVVSPDGREILTESNLEAKAAYVLLAHPEVAALREQPGSVSYLDPSGVPHMHTFDFIALLKDGTRVAVLVKAAAIAERRGTRALLEQLARQVPASIADRFVLLTERELDPDRVHDARLINAARLHPDPEHDAAIRVLLPTLNGPVEIASLTSMSGLGGAGFRAVVRLIADGTLVKAGHGRIAPTSLVRVVGQGGGGLE